MDAKPRKGKSGKCLADKHTKIHRHKQFIMGVMTFVVAVGLACLAVLCVTQSRTLRSLENRAKLIKEGQKRLGNEVEFIELERDNSTSSTSYTGTIISPDTGIDGIGNQQPNIRVSRAVSRRRQHRNNSSRRQRPGRHKGKNNQVNGKKRVRGASFVVNTKSRDCTFHGPVLIPRQLGTDVSKSVQIMCWINATDEKKFPWVTTKGGIISFQRKGYYHVAPTLSLQLPDYSCVDTPGQATSVGFAVYKKGVYESYGEEQQILRCNTGLRCDSREVWTCTSSRIVYLRPDDKLWVRVEGSLRRLASVWHYPAYTSINIVKL